MNESINGCVGAGVPGPARAPAGRATAAEGAAEAARARREALVPGEDAPLRAGERRRRRGRPDGAQRQVENLKSPARDRRQTDAPVQIDRKIVPPPNPSPSRRENGLDFFNDVYKSSLSRRGLVEDYMKNGLFFFLSIRSFFVV